MTASVINYVTNICLMKRAITCIIVVFAAFTCSAQKEWAINGWDSTYYYESYLDSIHKTRASELNNLTRCYYYHVFFKLDEQQNIIDYSLVENPPDPVPEQVREYTRRLFESGNGKWQPVSLYQTRLIPGYDVLHFSI